MGLKLLPGLIDIPWRIGLIKVVGMGFDNDPHI